MLRLLYQTIGAPPCGLHIILGTSEQPMLVVMANLDQGENAAIDMRTHFVISSLRSTVLKFRVPEKVGQSHADLLRDDLEHCVRNLCSQVETINIFSVASGDLCERLLRIMMISLLKNIYRNSSTCINLKINVF